MFSPPIIDLTIDSPNHPKGTLITFRSSPITDIADDLPWSLPPRKRKPTFSLFELDDDEISNNAAKSQPRIQRQLPYWGSSKPLLQPPKAFKQFRIQNDASIVPDDESNITTHFRLTNRVGKSIESHSSELLTSKFEQADSLCLPTSGESLQMSTGSLPTTFKSAVRKRRSSSSAPVWIDDDDLADQVMRNEAGQDFDLGTNADYSQDTEQDIIDLERDEDVMAAEEREDDENEKEMEASLNFVAGDWQTDEAFDNYLHDFAMEQQHDERRQLTFGPEDFLTEEKNNMILRRLRLDGNQNRRLVPVRPTPQKFPLQSVHKGEHVYRPGTHAEFEDQSFMRIRSLHRDSNGDVQLVGLHLIRESREFLIQPQEKKNMAEEETLLMPRRRNEVVWTCTLDADAGADQRGSMVRKPLSQAKGTREINFTNQSWPCMSARIFVGETKDRVDLFDKGPLFCRWKRIKKVKTASQDYQESIERLSYDEADVEYRVKEEKLRYAWRRCKTVPGGNFSQIRESVAENGKVSNAEVRQYTFGDCFCGAGGASRGADDAGLRLIWGVDHWDDAVRSWRSNFRQKGASCYQQGIHDFIHRVLTSDDLRYMTDILHMSPPCQPFSLAHTIENLPNDEQNQAPLLSIAEILKAVKPRVVTMEETPGLFCRHKDWFSRAVRDFVDTGYSVTWMIMHCEKNGVAQLRKRLVIIAAGPGEKLPPFPPATHGNGCSKPLLTIKDVIGRGKIPPNATHHAVISRFSGGRPKTPMSWNKQAATLTCGGGQKNYHPSGLRPYTVREAANLQGFPWYHSFATAKLTSAKRQIGNAFPPPMAKAVYQEIKKSLHETDATREEIGRGFRQAN